MRTSLIALLVSLASFAAASAQAPASVLDGVYTAPQAARGEAAYSASCAGCHEGQDADGPQLMGTMFLDRWREDRLSSLFDFIRTSMPGNLPGSLEERTYTDIVAYLLQANGLPAGQRELTAASVGGVQLVGPGGPKPLANLTIVRAVGCLSQEGDTWTLARAGNLAAVRARVVDGTSPEELKGSAAQPLGSLSFRLSSVPEKSAAHVGQKVQVKGVLTRQNTVERINVMSLEAVAATCGG